jgi:nucleoside-diphosphate-sugar epimerase
VLWAISGGAGFLGLHLARRLLADGVRVRTLDVAALDDPGLEASVEEVLGDVRDPAAAASLVAGADVLVHAAAALPIQASRASIFAVNVAGTSTLLDAALAAGVRRVVFVSSTAVYGVREGRRIPILGDGENRYQLLAVEDLVDAVVRAADADAAGETLNVGATEFGTVRSDIEALIRHAGSSSRLRPVPVRPAEIALRALELARVSPLAEWHYRTAHRDSFVDVSKARRLLGWEPERSNERALTDTYDWYLANRGHLRAAGVTHRVPWNQQALGLLKRLS